MILVVVQFQRSPCGTTARLWQEKNTGEASLEFMWKHGAFMARESRSFWGRSKGNWFFSARGPFPCIR